MEDCRPVLTPMEELRNYEERLELDKESDEPTLKNIPYREGIGSLMHLMIGTRPGLTFSVGKLCQLCESPKEKHWTAVKRVLRYICGTQNMGITFDGGSDISIVGFSDSDWEVM